MLKKAPVSLNASLGDSSHNPMDWQGRSYENVKGIELIAFWSIVFGLAAVILIVLMNIFS